MEVSKERTYYINYNLQLFAKDGPNGEKTEEPTSKKLRDARNKGQVAKSTDVSTAFALMMFFVLLKLLVGYVGNSFMEGFHFVYNNIADITSDEFTIQYANGWLRRMISFLFSIVWPFFAVSFSVAIVSQIFQVKWKVTFEPLKPKFSKFNPISGVKRLFSKDKLVELLKSIAKVGVMAYVVYDYIKDKWVLIYDFYSISLWQAIAQIGDLIVNIGFRISLCFIVIAFVDYKYQKWKFHEDMKMTKQEVKDEYKNAEGDPKIKSQQRQRMQEASRRRMMQELPKADVVITNPTHLAVAIQYDKERYDAPIVLAKGADYLAMKIKDVARDNMIEIVENKPLARMLYHNVEIGEMIPPELYQMVAEVLAYVYNLKGKTG